MSEKMAMHSCEVTKEELMDLLFDEIEAGRGRRLLAEVENCPACLRHYRAMAQILNVFDRAAEALTPAENFWTGYEERFKERMAQELQLNLWQGTNINTLPIVRGDFRLTILEDKGLLRRLGNELKAVAHESELTWPEFRRDPMGFTGRMVAGYAQLGKKFFAQEHAAPALMAPLCMLLFVGSAWAFVANRCLFLSHFGGRCEQSFAVSENEGLRLIGMVPIPREQEQPEPGAAGLNEGKGGGSTQNRQRPGGGGGGGNENPQPESYGKIAPGRMEDQIMAPTVRQPTVKNPELAVSPTLKGDPLLLPEDMRPIPFGDPRSTAQIPSDGSGTGGGQGTGDGSGQGPGDGKGYGPGHGENTGGDAPRYSSGGPGGSPNGGSGTPPDYTRIFKTSEVTKRAVIISKPDPGFTEDARKNYVTGVVRLRAVLNATGTVTGIAVINGLPAGLTERAITAAKSIKFQPAQKDGRAVSQYITLEYNFNIY